MWWPIVALALLAHCGGEGEDGGGDRPDAGADGAGTDGGPSGNGELDLVCGADELAVSGSFTLDRVDDAAHGTTGAYEPALGVAVRFRVCGVPTWFRSGSTDGTDVILDPSRGALGPEASVLPAAFASLFESPQLASVQITDGDPGQPSFQTMLSVHFGMQAVESFTMSVTCDATEDHPVDTTGRPQLIEQDCSGTSFTTHIVMGTPVDVARGTGAIAVVPPA